MNREARRILAEETLEICKNQKYTNSKKETVKLYGNTEEGHYLSTLYYENDFNRLLNSEPTTSPVNTNLRVVKDSVVDVIVNCGQKAHHYGKIGVLNFASARHAGGGFLKGSQAQEEAIASASDLHVRLKYFDNFYKYKKHFDSPLYSHRMIYTNNLAVFRDAKGNLLNEVLNIDLITSPAVNVRDIKRKGLYDLFNITEAVMDERIERIIALAKHNKVETLLLGAFGSGVFENNPYKVKESFMKALNKPEYRSEFKHVIFAIYEKPQDRNKLYNIFSSIRIK